jgi:hypothetical protein
MQEIAKGKIGTRIRFMRDAVRSSIEDDGTAKVENDIRERLKTIVEDTLVEARGGYNDQIGRDAIRSRIEKAIDGLEKKEIVGRGVYCDHHINPPIAVERGNVVVVVACVLESGKVMTLTGIL